MSSPSTEIKIAIVKQTIAQTENTIYDLSIRAGVAMKIGDKENAKRLSDDLVKFEKMLDEYNKILAELNSTDPTKAAE